MPLVKNKTTEQNRRFWSHVEAIARETDTIEPLESRENSYSAKPQREQSQICSGEDKTRYGKD